MNEENDEFDDDMKFLSGDDDEVDFDVDMEGDWDEE